MTTGRASDHSLGHVVRGKSWVELVSKFNQDLVPRTGGGYWAQSLKDGKLFLNARHTFYAYGPEGCRAVSIPFYAIMRPNVRQDDDGLTAVIPTAKQLHDSYRNASQKREDLAYQAVVRTFAPQVAELEWSIMNKFRLLWVEYLARHEPIPHTLPDIKSGYVQYLLGLGLIDGTEKTGYLASSNLQKLREHYIKVMEEAGERLAPDSEIPFVAACLQKPDVLAQSLGIKAPKTYFVLLRELFATENALLGGELRGKAEDAPASMPWVSHRTLAQRYDLHGMPAPTRKELDARMLAMVNSRIVEKHPADDGSYRMVSKWFNRAQAAYNQSLQRFVQSRSISAG